MCDDWYNIIYGPPWISCDGDESAETVLAMGIVMPLLYIAIILFFIIVFLVM